MSELCNATGFGFSEALTWLKNGYRVAREGWNGKGQFIYLVPEGAYAPFKFVAFNFIVWLWR